MLSGEGADELLGICISTKHQTHENSTKKMFVNGKLHMYDCLRAKSLAAWELKDVCRFR
jgi:asparagine synthetase B (glutamine-hydrolysing)